MVDLERSGQVFIAYKGTEFTQSDIENALLKICPEDYSIKCFSDDKAVFAKIVFYKFMSERDPFWNRKEGIITVNGYNQDELARANKVFSFYNIEDVDRYHMLINYMYRDYRNDMFKALGSHMHFCSAIYDKNADLIIAGVTKPNSKYTHLFYGYTKQNKELIFSNDENVLEGFCYEINKMPDNTFMKNGELYTLDDEKVNKDRFKPFIRKNNENTGSLIEGLNFMLAQISDEVIRVRLKQYVEEYLASEESKQQVTDFLFNELDSETKKQLILMIKNVIGELKDEINDEIKEEINKQVAEYTSKVKVPVVHIIKINDNTTGQTKGGFYHKKFEQILKQVQLDEPVMLIGPAGSGKNVIVSQVADALGQHMYYTNNASNEYKLTGFIDAGGEYRSTEFYKAFTNGGIFFLDEIDNSDPSALIVINSALANGYMAFPHETIDRHPDFKMVAAANTWGKGANLEHVGRNALDASTLDRFDNIYVDYDTDLESALYPNSEVLNFMWSFREGVYKSNIKHIVSTRGIGKVYKNEINGIPVEDTLESIVIKNLRQDDVDTIIGNMEDINPKNKYFDGIKRIRLRK